MMIKRFISLDVFRGLTIALMILVNSPGNKVTYTGLAHSVWDGCTLADLVFPFFLVIIGISSVLALSNLQAQGIGNKQLIQKIIIRSAYIFALGLLLNAFSWHFDLATIRILGVLQRIAICYLFSSLLFLSTKKETQLVIISLSLAGYGLLMTPLLAFDSGTIHNNLVAYVDRLLLTPQHLYTPTFDPEGLLSTLSAIASALLGNLIGYCLISPRTKSQQLYWIMMVGFVLSISGFILSQYIPLNKSIWSVSYVLWTGGLAFLVFALCYALIEMKHWSRWSIAFSLLGKNALLVYVLHVAFLKIQSIILIRTIDGELINLRLFITNFLFEPFALKNASLFYAFSYLLFWLFFLKMMKDWLPRFKMNHLKIWATH